MVTYVPQVRTSHTLESYGGLVKQMPLVYKSLLKARPQLCSRRRASALAAILPLKLVAMAELGWNGGGGAEQWIMRSEETVWEKEKQEINSVKTHWVDEGLKLVEGVSVHVLPHWMPTNPHSKGSNRVRSKCRFADRLSPSLLRHWPNMPSQSPASFASAFLTDRLQLPMWSEKSVSRGRRRWCLRKHRFLKPPR